MLYTYIRTLFSKRISLLEVNRSSRPSACVHKCLMVMNDPIYQTLFPTNVVDSLLALSLQEMIGVVAPGNVGNTYIRMECLCVPRHTYICTTPSAWWQTCPFVLAPLHSERRPFLDHTTCVPPHWLLQNPMIIHLCLHAFVEDEPCKRGASLPCRGYFSTNPFSKRASRNRRSPSALLGGSRMYYSSPPPPSLHFFT